MRTTRISVGGVVTMCFTAAAASLAAENKAFEPTEAKEHSVVITEGREEYSIMMGGTVDMDHALTKLYASCKVAFQPQVALTIENVGKTLVANPRVISNDRRRWWTAEEMTKEFTAGAANDTEEALMIWQAISDNMYHFAPLFVQRGVQRQEQVHPVRMLNIYGEEMCGARGSACCFLSRLAGFDAAHGGQNPHGLSLIHADTSSEVWADGGYRVLNVDLRNFFLDRENDKPVSAATACRDHDLVRREFCYGPEFRPDTGEVIAGIFGIAVPFTWDLEDYRMSLTLRPGEKMIYRWDNIGKLAGDGGPETMGDPRMLSRRYFGNSKHVFTPRLTADEYKTAVFEEQDIVAREGRLAGHSADAYVVYRVQLPYTVCGASVSGKFEGGATDDRFALDTSLDGKEWMPVWTQTGHGEKCCRVEMDSIWKCDNHAAIREYYFKVSLLSARPGSANLLALKMETDFLAAPLSLPRLSLGENRIEYSDDTTGPRELKVTYQWRETKKPVLEPPQEPVFPAPDGVVRKTAFDFAWPPTPGATANWIRVSKRPDMKLPYRAYYDAMVKRASHGSPMSGMFSPNTDYYWRVKVQDKAGVWSDWSPVWRFRWEGPRVPVNVAREINGKEIRIRWEPNPRGARPIVYDVYGSDERGFSVSKKAFQYAVPARRIPDEYKNEVGAMQPPNFIARTTATEMTVVGDDPRLPNKSFFRVVAVDAAGVESGCSDYVEMPHPFVYSTPPSKAKVGQRYEYSVKTLRSIGDILFRDGSMFYAEKEEYERELVKGPAWLKLDKTSGRISGTPASADVGLSDVEIRLTRTYPFDLKAPDLVKVKTLPQYQAEDRQTFQIRVEP